MGHVAGALRKTRKKGVCIRARKKGFGGLCRRKSSKPRNRIGKVAVKKGPILERNWDAAPTGGHPR